MPLKRRLGIAIGVLAFAVLSFAFSESFRETMARRRALHRAEAELDRLNKDVADARSQVQRVESDPSAREELVRRELGYLRPGEKEVRFLPDKE